MKYLLAILLCIDDRYKLSTCAYWAMASQIRHGHRISYLEHEIRWKI